jgi:RNA polymerase sigma factor (sigma-70 family)
MRMPKTLEKWGKRRDERRRYLLSSARMDENRTTAAVQGYLNALANAPDAIPSEEIVRALLARSVHRLHLLCGSMLHRSYPRLTRPPMNLQAEELLSAVVERLIRALRAVHPPTVRHFFALANQHMRWELNDLARRLDKEGPHLELHESLAQADPLSQSGDANTSATQRMLAAIESLPEEEREVLGLVRVQGMTHVEAADVLGVSAKTIQRRLNRCLALLDESCGDIIHPDPG